MTPFLVLSTTFKLEPRTGSSWPTRLRLCQKVPDGKLSGDQSKARRDRDLTPDCEILQLPAEGSLCAAMSKRTGEWKDRRARRPNRGDPSKHSAAAKRLRRASAVDVAS